MNFDTNRTLRILGVILILAITAATVITTMVVESQKTERVKYAAGYEQVIDTARVFAPAYQSPVWKKSR